MAETDGKQAVARLILPEITEEDKSIYANHVIVNHTPWDFALHFGSVVTPLQPKLNDSGELEIQVKKLLTINIPSTLIKGLINALQTSLDRYEKQYGKVKTPGEDK
jgi:hypothetical protein